LSAYSRGMGDPSLASEISPFERAQAGCPVSLGHLMERHSGLIRAAVRQQFLGDLPFAEALQAGRIGLWHAILGFDPQRGPAFSSYAWPAIVRYVWQAVRNHARQESRPLVELPPADSLGADPVPWQPALQRLVHRLPQRLQQVIVAYYGLDGQPPASYRQLGARLGLSHERVRQLHIEALVWLRQPAHSQTLRSLLQRHTVADYEAADALAQCWLRKRAGRHGH